LQKKGLLQTAKQVCNAPSVDGFNMFQGYSFKHVHRFDMIWSFLRHLIKKTQSTTRLVAWKTSNCGRRVSDFEKVSSGQMLESYGCNTSKNEVKHQN
jgi:endo-1,4-beta-D-glucanase Y